jgi:hypothetical protein
MEKVNYRKKFKQELISYLEANNLYYDKDIIKSVMSKAAINSRNKYGTVDWEEEMFEAGIDNGVYFYEEYGKKDTYNRKIKNL